jgi:hypothetical protein
MTGFRVIKGNCEEGTCQHKYNMSCCFQARLGNVFEWS